MPPHYLKFCQDPPGTKPPHSPSLKKAVLSYGNLVIGNRKKFKKLKLTFIIPIEERTQQRLQPLGLYHYDNQMFKQSLLSVSGGEKQSVKTYCLLQGSSHTTCCPPKLLEGMGMGEINFRKSAYQMEPQGEHWKAFSI